MKRFLRMSVWCLFVALLMNAAFSQWVGSTGRVLMIQDKHRVWMLVDSGNGEAWDNEGFDPHSTTIVTDYQPMYRPLPNGKFMLKFIVKK